MTELNLAYIAGIIDGEGSIMLLKTHATDMFKKPYISVTSTSFEIIDLEQNSKEVVINLMIKDK